ncbi:MAG: tRNA 2-thiouridine(34) synthase MnmA [Magnetococcales bacterium]|nr:tRNA 2-thiouridine(34) synthase MnmA [Magnetococcales bacterium]
MKKKVAIAMSGGVDSAVAAAWLVDQGHEVIGLTMQLWDHGEQLSPSSRTCCATEDLYDARQVAQRLDIPFYVVNLEEQFRQAVVEDFLSSYEAGQTPNPCVRCNQRLKFETLLNKALSLGVDYLATGHYAIKKEDKNGHPLLYKGVDRFKDQSYFLFATTVAQLGKLDFPLGGLTKDKTRQLADRFDLHLSQKRESQDVCFVPDGDYKAFFMREGSTAANSGLIVDLDGNVLGEHKGLGNHTIGQRKGLGISAPNPLYVVKIISEKNQLVVGPESALYGDSLTIKDLNWLCRQKLEQPRQVQAKIRYASNSVPATISPSNKLSYANLQFDNPQKSITPGQACVLYDGDRVLGGGWIS